MRYWDVARQLYPSAIQGPRTTYWGQLAQSIASKQFPSVEGMEIEPDIALALSSRSEAPAGAGKPWPKTMHCISTLSPGGAERQIVNLMTELARRGHDNQTLLTIYPLEG